MFPLSRAETVVLRVALVLCALLSAAAIVFVGAVSVTAG